MTAYTRPTVADVLARKQRQDPFARIDRIRATDTAETMAYLVSYFTEHGEPEPMIGEPLYLSAYTNDSVYREAGRRLVHTLTGTDQP